jgi:hypothetical protein
MVKLQYFFINQSSALSNHLVPTIRIYSISDIINLIYVSQNLYATMKNEHSIPAILESIKT